MLFNVIFILSCFLIIAAIIGMQFFAGKLKFDDDGKFSKDGLTSRSNFDKL